MNRRTFLIRAGASGAALLASGTWQPRPLEAASTLTAELAGLVHDLETRFPYAYALYSRDETLNFELGDDGSRLTTQGPNEGIVAGIWDGAMIREEATSLADAAGIARLRERLMALPPPLSKEGAPDPGPALEKEWIEAGRVPIGSRTIAQRVDELSALRESVKKRSAALANVRMESLQGETERIFVNRTRTLHQRLSRAGVGGVAIARNGDGKRGFLGIRFRGVGGLEHAALSEPVIASWVERAERLAGAPSPEPGEMFVVSEPNVTGVVAHESFGHGVELDMFVKGRARAAEFIDKPVGSKLVNISD
ncbi:MAG TPA: hypothetical protein VF720_10735, partial [Candidatus Eisenbacteria bacterium]